MCRVIGQRRLFRGRPSRPRLGLGLGCRDRSGRDTCRASGLFGRGSGAGWDADLGWRLHLRRQLCMLCIRRSCLGASHCRLPLLCWLCLLCRSAPLLRWLGHMCCGCASLFALWSRCRRLGRWSSLPLPASAQLRGRMLLERGGRLDRRLVIRQCRTTGSPRGALPALLDRRCPGCPSSLTGSLPGTLGRSRGCLSGLRPLARWLRNGARVRLKACPVGGCGPRRREDSARAAIRQRNQSANSAGDVIIYWTPTAAC